MIDDVYSIFYVNKNNEIESIYVFGGGDWRERLGFIVKSQSGGGSSEELELDWDQVGEDKEVEEDKPTQQSSKSVISGAEVEEEEEVEVEEEGSVLDESEEGEELIDETTISSSSSSVENLKIVEDVSDIFSDPKYETQVRRVFKDKGLYDQITNTQIYMVHMYIHPDDSIQTIKYKFLHSIRRTDQSTNFNSYDELYMYSPVSYSFLLNEIYQKITQNGSIELSKIGILQFLSTMYKFNEYAERLNQILGDREECTYEDLIQLNMNQEDYIVNIPLGQEFRLKRQYPIPTNPHNWTHISTFLGDISPVSNILRDYSTDIAHLDNNKTLITHGHIRHNILFALNCADIIEAVSSVVEPKIIISLYFPNLYNKNIYDLKTLEDKRNELKRNTTQHLTEAFHNRNHIIDMFYRISRHRGDIKPRGYIREMTITVSQKSHMTLPLDYIFNLIPTSAKIPMTRYHEDVGYMKLYRLYSTQTATNGKRVPVLDMKYINYANLRSGRIESVMFYIKSEVETAEDEHILKTQTKRKKDKIEIEDTPHIYNLTTCVLQRNGTVKITIVRISPITIENVRQILIEDVEPLLKQIKKYIDKAGLKFKTTVENGRTVIDPILYRIMGRSDMTHITYDNVNIHNIHYITSIPMEEKEYSVLKEPFLSLLTPIFSIYKGEINKSNKVIDLKFRRVSLYNENNDAKDFVIMSLEEEKSIDYIIKQLVDVYKMNDKEAKILVQGIITTAIVVNNDQGKNTITVNTGFLSDLYLKDQHMICYIHDMDSLEYVPIMNMYIQIVLLLLKHYNLNDEDFFHYFGVSKTSIDEIVGRDIQKEEDKDEVVGEPVYVGRLSDDESVGQLLSSIESDDSSTEEMINRMLGGSKKNVSNILAERRKRHKELFQPPYVTKCQPNVRHPLFMTEEEKSAYEKKNPDYFKTNDAFRYGKGSKKLWFSCPRYISTRDFSPVDEKDVRPEHLIEDTDNIKEGQYIYDRLKSAKAKYMHPGFIKQGNIKNKDGFAFTCCFAEAERQIKDGKFVRAIDDDVAKYVDFGGDEEIERLVEKKDDRKNLMYLYDNLRGMPPIAIGRLPDVIASLFDMDYSKVVSSSVSSMLKTGATAILRYGVSSMGKTYVSPFVNALATYFNEDMEVLENGVESEHPSVENLLKHFEDVIAFDDFNGYFGGVLSHLFEDIDDIYKSEYGALSTDEKEKLHNIFYASKFYQNLRKKLGVYRTHKIKEIDIRRYMSRILYAYYRFKKMLIDENEVVDYSHLWDIIQQPHPDLFEEGVNMIIIEERGNQSHIVCPRLYMTSRKPVFYPHKKTIIMYNKVDDNTFYPIYKVSNKSRKRHIERFFDNDDPMIKNVIEKVKEAYRLCANPHFMSNIPNVYMTEANITADELVRRVEKSGDTTYQVVGKVRHEERTYISGVILSKGDVRIVVPVEPSLGKVDSIFDDQRLSYRETVDILNEIAGIYDIPCRPYKKVVEGGNIVGVYTIGGNFVGVVPQKIIDIESDGLEQINDVDEIMADRNVFFSKQEKNERINEIKMIYLEDKYYSVFRQLLRVLYEDNRHIKERKAMEIILREKTEGFEEYKIKLVKVERRLREFIGKYVVFKDIRQIRVNEKQIQEYYTAANNQCVIMRNQKDKKVNIMENYSAYIDNVCKTIFPEVNLVTDKKNNYYMKLADELIRYGRIYDYIFNPEIYVMFEPVKMQLEMNEFVYSDLDNEYVKDIDVARLSKWIKGNSYFTHQPVFDNSVKEVLEV
jgi:hypothetical protein